MDRNPLDMSYEELKLVLAQEDHYRHAEALNEHLTWRADPSGKVTHLSGQLKAAIGLQHDEIMGDRWIAVIHPDDREKTLEHFNGSIETGEPMSYTNRLYDRNAGTYRWTRVSARPRRNKSGDILAWYGVTSDIHDSLMMIERQSTLLQELNHRVKNSLATVQSIVMQTFRSLKERDEYNIEAYQTFCDKVMDRLLILSSAHDLLTANAWTGTDMGSLINHTLLAIMGDDRYVAKGPNIELNPNAALLLAMVFHELGTNAIKYGAWSNDRGKVDIQWSIEDQTVKLIWRERKGPRIKQPDHVGFGTKLITKTGLRELSGTTDMHFDPLGLTCYFTFSLSEKMKRS